MTRRRIIVYNTFARDATAKWRLTYKDESIGKDYSVTVTAPNEDEAKRIGRRSSNAYDRLVKIEPVPAQDVVGTKEDLAYGAGYHATFRENPYTGTEGVAWERGRKAAKLAGKLRKNEYMSGEYGPTGAGMKRNIQFQQPRARDAARRPHWTSMYEREWLERSGNHGYTVEKNTEPHGRGNGKVHVARNREGEVVGKYDTFIQGGYLQPPPRARDFRSERGYVAKILGPQGQIWQKSEPRISPAGAQNWAKAEAEKYAKQGKRVTIQVESVMFDPEREYA